MNIASPEFWVALIEIIGVNIVLSGDNAVVIALAARGLPAHQQRRAVAWGSGAAVVMRIILTIVAVELLRLPYLKLVGAALLVWIAVQLLLPDEGSEGTHATGSSMAAAIKTILLADLVMSLDNVIGVAAAAKGSTLLLVLGLAISIPLVIFASQLLLVMMSRFPMIITAGAALLGWVAGEMAITDPAVADWVNSHASELHYLMPALGAIGVVAVGKWLAARAAADVTEPVSVSPSTQVTGPVRRLLLGVDGSEGAALAVKQAIRLRQSMLDPSAVEVHVVNVQRPVTADVFHVVGHDSIESYHREQGEQALAPARALLSNAGIACTEHRAVGDPGPTIAQMAGSLGADIIIMGTRGMSGYAAALIGSVAQRTTEHSTVPVLLVK